VREESAALAAPRFFFPGISRVLSFGDRIPCGDYRLLSKFDAALNFTGSGRLVAVVTDCVGGGPINIVLEGTSLPDTERLEVRRGSFSLDATAFPRRPLYDSALPKPAAIPERMRQALRSIQSAILEAAHPKSLAFLLDESRLGGLRPGFEIALAAKFRDAAAAMAAGQLAQGAAAVSGLGWGLTPCGDDFLAGYLWGLHARQHLDGKDLSESIAAVHGAARSANPLSAAFLDCAREGRCFEKLRGLLAALMAGDAREAPRRARELLAVGETSGADTCVGLLAALN